MAAAPCCCLCSSQDAVYICECKSPAIPICEDCFHPDHSSHPYFRFEVKPQFQPRESGEVNIVSNVYCTICSNPALVICICLSPLQGFCEADFPSHKAKFPQASHYPIAVSRLSSIPTTRSQDLIAFRDRQILIDQTLDRVRDSREDLQRKRAQTEQVLNDLFLQLDTVRREKMEEMDRRIGDIEEKITRFEHDSEQLRFNPGFTPQSRLEYFVQCQQSEELTRHKLDFLKVSYPGLADATHALDHLIQIKANLQLFDQAPVSVPREMNQNSSGNAIFPFVSSMHLVLFQLPTCQLYSKLPFERNNRPLLDDYSQIVVLANGTIFCVGGKDSAFAYTITPNTCNVRKEPDMTRKRGNSGLIFHPPYIYVFGGTCNSVDLRHCERFCRENRVWLPMRSSMQAERSRFSPCFDTDKVFLLGGGPKRGEYYSIPQDSCYLFPFEVPCAGSAITFRASDGRIVCISDNDMYRVVENRLERLGKPCNFEPFSHIAPVTIGEKLYFTDWSSEMKIITVNLRDLTCEELASHSPALL